ncbi:MAG: zinc ribbon domain-containing protein [Chloroflexi bacterium]|nr:zinc ribbon domain-containing protein [Chloroflexota bacterium]
MVPVYEYRCPQCRRRISKLFLTFAEVQTPSCPQCRVAMVKLVSLFSTHRSDDERLEDFSDPATFADVDENDPRSIARWARKMGKELGEDLGPEFDEAVDALERGDEPMDNMDSSEAESLGETASDASLDF